MSDTSADVPSAAPRGVFSRPGRCDPPDPPSPSGHTVRLIHGILQRYCDLRRCRRRLAL